MISHQGPGWKIHCGNALDVLASLPPGCADVVIADPPYSSGGLHLAARQRDPVAKYQSAGVHRSHETFSGDNRDQRSWYRWTVAWLREAARCLTEPGYVLMFSDWRQLPTASDALQGAGLAWRGILVWDKTESARAPNQAYFRHQCEYIVWGTKSVPSRISAALRGPWPGCYRCRVNPAEKQHVTAKPLPLMRDLCRVCPEGGTVLDPFFGAGSTALAAVQTGRRFIGSELNNHFFDLTHARLKGIHHGTPLPAA